MATKLRKFSRSKGLKFAAFTLTVLLITQIALQYVYVINSDLNPEALFVEDYTHSEFFLHDDMWQTVELVIGHIVTGTKPSGDSDYYYYYYNDGVNIYSNTDLSELKDYKYYYEYNITPWDYRYYFADDYNEIDDPTIYMAFSDEYIQEKQQEWNKIRSELIPVAVLIIQSIIGSLICIVYLILVTGRRAEDDEVHLTPYVDRLYSDIQLGAMIFTLFIWYCGIIYFIRQFGYKARGNFTYMDNIISIITIGTLTLIATIICGVILLSMVRKIKARKLLKHSLFYTILSGISNFIRSLFDDSRFEHFPLTKSLNRRQIIFTVLSGLMVFLSFIFVFTSILLGLVPVVIEGVIIFWYFYENNKTFEEINQGFHESYKEQMKSERMKVDLITNVSHDLKTPLTSIISYVDLLSKEDLPETARDYVNILCEKSGRLKNIVSDLFDLAKSTSGNLPLNMENLDLKKLIEQTLADMEDEIGKSNMRIKTTLTESPVYIYSDGKKLYRVFQNIIGNALKYSLQGTRIFIDMKIENYFVNVIVKNTASYDMDFTADEILQRFNRGDKARTTEGSGLGLSIAESFTWACGGKFQVEIDGDQFKVILGFPIYSMVPPADMVTDI